MVFLCQVQSVPKSSSEAAWLVTASPKPPRLVGRVVVEYLLQRRSFEDVLTPGVQLREGCLCETRMDCRRQGTEEFIPEAIWFPT